LLELDRGKTLQAVARTLGVSSPTVLAWHDKYREQGLKCLSDVPRSGRPIEIAGKRRAQITALALKPLKGAPAGAYACWRTR
jgi:transposase